MRVRLNYAHSLCHGPCPNKNRNCEVNKTRAGLGGDAVLLDASTVGFLSDPTRYDALTGNCFTDPSVSRHLIGLLQRSPGRRHLTKADQSDRDALVSVLGFLEIWLLHDQIVVDRAALESIQSLRHSKTVCEVASLLFNVTQLPPSVNEEAASNAGRYGEWLKNSDDPVFARGARHGIPDLDIELKDRFYSKLSGYLGVSSNSPERALFYLEVSKLLGLPLLIHPRKAEYLSHIGESIAVQRKRAYSQLVDDVKGELGYEEEHLPIPPIADLLVRIAMEKSCPLVEAARVARDDKTLRSLRNLIRQLSDPRKGRIYREESIRNKAKSIATRLKWQVYPGGRISSRRINLARIQDIGPLLSIIGAEDPVVPDLILFERPYRVLFSKWANSGLRSW